VDVRGVREPEIGEGEAGEDNEEERNRRAERARHQRPGHFTLTHDPLSSRSDLGVRRVHPPLAARS